MQAIVVEGPGAGRRPHRDAILTAARDLAIARGSGGFTVNDVAEKAGVSRRTVFNYFASVDALLASICEETLVANAGRSLDLLDEALAGLSGSTQGDEQVLDAVCAVFADADFVSAAAVIARLFADAVDSETRAVSIARTALEALGVRVYTHVQESGARVDPLKLDFTLAMLVAGVVVLGRRWAQSWSGARSQECHERWSAASAVLIAHIRDGYRAHAKH